MLQQWTLVALLEKRATALEALDFLDWIRRYGKGPVRHAQPLGCPLAMAHQ